MTTSRHPVTGVQLNDIDIVRSGKLTDRELETARILLAAGLPRWLVSARLGVFPLAFSGAGRKPATRRIRPRGTRLSRRAAQRDPRQGTLFR